MPAILDEGLIDERIPMDLDRAAETTRDLARAGLFVGPSSGAYVRAALDLTQRRECGVIVTLLNDTGERYGSTGLWNVGGK